MKKKVTFWIDLSDVLRTAVAEFTQEFSKSPMGKTKTVAGKMRTAPFCKVIVLSPVVVPVSSTCVEVHGTSLVELFDKAWECVEVLVDDETNLLVEVAPGLNYAGEDSAKLVAIGITLDSGIAESVIWQEENKSQFQVLAAA